MRSNWDHATEPRPETECPHCGDDRQVERIDGSKTAMFCNVCGYSWRTAPSPPKKDPDAD